MEDVQLWWKLHDAPTPDLAPELEQLAKLTIQQRSPFFGLVAPLLSHDDVSLRAAAVAVMAGARGVVGLRALVNALDDPDPKVRLAAVESLREVARHEPARWAHVVFHPRPDVRTAALAGEVPEACRYMGAFLLADPDNRTAAQLVPFPKPGLGLITGLFRRGDVPPDFAAERYAAVTSANLRDWILASRRRTPEQLRRSFTNALDGRGLDPEGDDALDLWVQAVATASHDPARHATATMAEAILAARLTASRSRLTVAVLRHATHHGTSTIPETLTHLAAACDPRFIAIEALDLPLRRIAATGLVHHRDRLTRDRATLVPHLLCSNLVTDGSTIHLHAAVGIVCLLRDRRLATLEDHFGRTKLGIACARDLPGFRAACSLRPERRPGAPETTQGLHFLELAKEATPDRTRTFDAIALGQFATADPIGLGRLLQTAAPVGELLVELVAQAQSGLLSTTAQVIGRLGRQLIPRARLGELSDVLSGLLTRTAHDPPEPAHAMLSALVDSCDPGDFAAAASTMSLASRRKLVQLACESIIFRGEHEMALAAALADDEDDDLYAWANGTADAYAAISSRPPKRSGHALTDDEQRAIATADYETLEHALAPAVARPCSGLTAALSRRIASEPHLTACVALVGCTDDPVEVSSILDLYIELESEFTDALRIAVIAAWDELTEAAVLTRAWLHGFERHELALLARIDAWNGGLLAFLRWVDALPGLAARRTVWTALASALSMRRYRDRPAMLAMISPQLDDIVEHIIAQLDTDVGVPAAKVLVTIHLSGVNIISARKAVLSRAPDMDHATLYELQRFVQVQGLPRRDTPANARGRAISEHHVEQIRRELDLDELTSRCRSPHPLLVRTAAQRLVELGTLGERRLVALLSGTPPVRNFTSIAQTLDQWCDAGCIAAVRAIARDSTVPAEMQYRLAQALHDRGESGWVVVMLAALRVPANVSWFRRGDWPELLHRFSGDERALALELTESSHPHVYMPAVEAVLAGPIDDDACDALRRFIHASALRPTDLRKQAAKALNDAGDPTGLPILLSAITESAKNWDKWLFKPPTPELRKALAELLLAATLWGGAHACDETRMLDLLDKLDVPRASRDEIMGLLLLDARAPSTTKRIVHQHGSRMTRMFKVFEIADIFAWGVRRGRELTGRLFRVHMTWRRGDYGHTYLDSNSIHVTPLPVLRKDRDGRDVVEALILHEFGHHMYHRGQDKQAVWGRATKEGLGHIMNLVADEHLERNLRALRREYGDRLKRLASYAFQHNDREMQVDALLSMLGAAAFDVLTPIGLGAAFDGRCVTVQSGNLLRELERIGQPFARFVRALRQGLGNRHEDPLVEQALDLFRHGFRHSTMEQLYEITKRLQELFGIETKLAEQFGGHETLKGTPRDASIHGEDIDDDEIQREVERILDPRQLDRMRGGSDDGGPPQKLAINVIDDDAFNKVTHVERVAPDPVKHKQISAEVRRHSDRVRTYFEELGLNYVPQRARLRGRSFDRTRTRAVVVRRDPRMLIARELTTTTDLFIGVVVDCSGSMRTGQSMDKAHRFGVLLADAIRGMSNVEARFFGFTDRVIYDAGDERLCAVAALQPGGGNNDAAALWHAAQVAERSQRRSKLLIMISDGLPTECSAASVRALADRLTRRRQILCAQVAVRPLSEICFPHYVEIKTGDPLDVAVRRFGEIVAGLAKQALGR